MRRGWVLGWGLAGVFAAHTTATAQFAADRPNPAPFGGLPAPASPPARPAPATGFQPAAAPSAGYQPPAPPAEVESALANHPWVLKPEHGPWMICVKSYAGQTASAEAAGGHSVPKMLAEELAKLIRDSYKVPAYLFEHVSEDRKAVLAARKLAQDQAAPFLRAVEEQRRLAEQRGLDFAPPDNKVRVRRANYPEQYAVLIGGFRTDEEARKALDKVRTWPAPKNERLLDGASSVQPGTDGRLVAQRAFLNPFGQAFVVPNPTVPRAAERVPGIDPFVVKLNEGRPFNLLAARKPWTLSVKTFDAPVEMIQDGNGGDTMRKPGGSKTADVLAATAGQADAMAKALRELKDRSGQSLGLEGFVFHTRTGSMVTVGQFDGPNDPELLRAKRLLDGMAFNIQDEKRMQLPGQQRLFDQVIPIPVPRP